MPAACRRQPSSRLRVAAGQPHRQPVELLGDDDLAAQPRGLAEVEGEVEHVLLVLARLLEQIVPIGVDDDMAGRAGERAFAGALDIDVVAMGDFEHRQAERRVDLAAGPVALDKDHLRHQLESAAGAAPGSGRGARSSARIAAASAGAVAPDCELGCRGEPQNRRARPARPPPSAAPPPPVSGAAAQRRSPHGSPGGRAPARRAAAPLRRARATPPPARARSGTVSTCSKPSRSASRTALPPTETATSASSAAGVDADRGSRRLRIGRPAVRLLDLKQLHAKPAGPP